VHLNSKLQSLISNNNIKQKDEEYDDEVPAFVEIEEELSTINALTGPFEASQIKLSDEEEVLRKSTKIRQLIQLGVSPQISKHLQVWLLNQQKSRLSQNFGKEIGRLKISKQKKAKKVKTEIEQIIVA
jgi:hypothetical protein